MDRISFPKFQFPFSTPINSKTLLVQHTEKLLDFFNKVKQIQEVQNVEEERKNLSFELFQMFEGMALELGKEYEFKVTPEAQEHLTTLLELCLNGGEKEEKHDEKVVLGHICGHVFAKNEIVYRCRDCGLDDTCVLCAKCYNPKVHQDHDVFYTVSSGNGCCDCGDPEAWLKDIQCPFHVNSKGTEASNSSYTDLDEGSSFDLPEISQFSRITITAVIHYFVKYLKQFLSPHLWKTKIPPNELLDAEKEGKKFVVLIYNDEVHSFDDVINQLQDTTGCSKEDAKKRADVVDSIGRDVVFASYNLKDCLTACENLEKIKLRCTTEIQSHMYKEAFVPVFLGFCTKLAKQNIGYRRLICELLCSEPETLDSLLLSDRGLWKIARIAFRDLVFSTLLLDQTKFKEILGLRFLHQYPTLIEYYLKEDPEPDLSIINISLQLFTTPSVVRYLVHQHSLLSIIMETLKKFFADAIPHQHQLIDCEHPAFVNERYSSVFYDLKYALSKATVADLIPANPEHLHKYLGLLSLFQGMHPQPWAKTVHIEYESQLWIKVFSLDMYTTRTIPLFASCFQLAGPETQQLRRLTLEWAISTTKDYIQQWQMTHTRENWQEHTDISLSLLQSPFGEFPVLNRNFTTRGENAPSLHNPLHWFLASLIKTGLLSTTDSQLDLIQLFKTNSNEYAMLWLMEGIVRVFVLLAQVSSSLWRKNGLSIVNQAFQYKGFLMRDQTYDLDLLLLQTSLVVLGPDHVLTLLTDRFSLNNWFSSSPTAPFDEAQNASMAEEFYSLIIFLLNERWIVGSASPEQKLKTYFIELLAGGPQLHSELMKKIDSDMSENSSFDQVLLEVATKKQTSGAEQEMYHLKDEYYKYFDPYFFHYRKNDRENAEEAIRQRRKKMKVPEPFTPPQIIPLKQPYKSLQNIIHSPVYCQMIFYGLWQNFPGSYSTSSKNKSFIPSATILDMALYMLVYALTIVSEKANSFSHEQPFIKFSSHLEFDIEDSKKTTILMLLLSLRKSPGFPIEEKQRFDWCLGQFERLCDDQMKNILSEFKIDIPQGEPELTEEQRKKKLAQQRQASLMQEFANRQQSFKSNFQDLLNQEDFQDDELFNENSEVDLIQTDSCIFCRNPCDINSGKGFGVLSLLQPSSLTKNLSDPVCQLTSHLTSNFDNYIGLDQEIPPNPELPASYQEKGENQFHFSGCFVSTCGHFMHTDCFEKFEKTYLQNSSRRPFFLCPLCKSFGDTLLPLSNLSLRKLSKTEEKQTQPFEAWLKALPPHFIELEATQQTNNPEPKRERSNSGVSKMKSFLAKLSTSPKSFTWISGTSPPSNSSSSNSNTNPLQLTLLENDNDLMEISDSEEAANKKSMEVVVEVKRPAIPKEILNSLKILSIKFEKIFQPIQKSREMSLTMLLDSYIYSLKCFEISNRGKQLKDGNFFFEGIANQEKLFCDVFSNVIDTTISSSDHSSQIIKEVARNFLRRTIWCLSPEDDINESYREIITTNITILIEDSFASFVKLMCVIPPTSISETLHFVHLFYILEIVKVSLALILNWNIFESQIKNQSENNNQKLKELGSTEEEKYLIQFLSFLHERAFKSPMPTLFIAKPRIFLQELKVRLLPFLRQASLFCFTHFNIPVPKDANLIPPSSEFEKLSSYLNFPTNLKESIDIESSVISQLISSWCVVWNTSEKRPSPLYKAVQNVGDGAFSQSTTGNGKESSSTDLSRANSLQSSSSSLNINSNLVLSLTSNLSLVSNSPVISLPVVLPIRLAPLPVQYDSLLIASSSSLCPKTSSVRTDPALCLICGSHHCCQSNCCREKGKGACNNHVLNCHGQVGLFLLDKQSVVLILQDGIGLFYRAPYFDAHGEPDPGLRRGRPLILNPKSHQHLRDLWASHKIHSLLTQKMDRMAPFESDWDIL